MKTKLRTLIGQIAAMAGALAVGALAQERRGGQDEALTAAQAAQVKSILSEYRADGLTADRAKAIHDAFRQAGLPGGPSLNAAVSAAGFDPDKLRDLAPPPDASAARGPQGREDNARPQQYSIKQAVSDEAQLHTIAFSGLAFLTGDFGADTFLPPGKVCDFFGFQYMRDIDAAQKGHNPMFLDRVAGNVLKNLSDSQRELVASAARLEAAQLQALAQKRLPLIKAFCRELEGWCPSGSQGLNRAAVVQYAGDIFALDAEISYMRAQVFGRLATTLTSAQKAYLSKMKFGDFNSWPAVDMEQHKLPQKTEKLVNVAYMTYASEFFSWYAGSVEADTYFCPERHGTYFGGFFMKDMPAMNKRDFDISTSLTGDSGKEFLNALTAEQRGHIQALPGLQRQTLADIVEVRRAIATELRVFLNNGTADRAKVLALGHRYGELDGELSYGYVIAFAKVSRTLTAEQRATLTKLRKLPGAIGAPAYLYSDPMAGEVKLSGIGAFFFPPK